MPEFLIVIKYAYGTVEYRVGDDARHTRRILAGLKGRYPSATLVVRSLIVGDVVTADFNRRP